VIIDWWWDGKTRILTAACGLIQELLSRGPGPMPSAMVCPAAVPITAVITSIARKIEVSIGTA
jgi:hypothetical protein